MSHAEITLKSGAVVNIDVDDIDIHKARDGFINRLSVDRRGPRELRYINHAEIAAIVFVNDEEDK